MLSTTELRDIALYERIKVYGTGPVERHTIPNAFDAYFFHSQQNGTIKYVENHPAESTPRVGDHVIWFSAPAPVVRRVVWDYDKRIIYIELEDAVATRIKPVATTDKPLSRN